MPCLACARATHGSASAQVCCPKKPRANLFHGWVCRSIRARQCSGSARRSSTTFYRPSSLRTCRSLCLVLLSASSSSLPRPSLCLVLCGPCLLPPLRHCKVALGAALVSMPPAPACHAGVPTSASCQRLTKGTGPRVTPLPGGTGRGREWHCLIGKTAE